jgi:hypothetical protein
MVLKIDAMWISPTQEKKRGVKKEMIHTRIKVCRNCLRGFEFSSVSDPASL